MKNSGAGQGGAAVRFGVSLAAVACYLAFAGLLGLYLAGWVSFSRGSREALASAARIDRLNPTYQYLLGRSFHLDLAAPSHEDAIEHYRASLRVSPLQPGVWLDLSKAYQALGNGPAAEHALERALSLSPNDGFLHWEAGIFWLVNGAREKALPALRRHLVLMPQNQHAVYDLCWKFSIPNDTILSELVPPEYAYRSKYLQYLIATKHADEAAGVWALIPLEEVEKSVFLSYVNYLINSGLYDAAHGVWKAAFQAREKGSSRQAEEENAPLVWNSGFEQDVLNGGFDWLISEAKGAKVFIDNEVRMLGSRSLGIVFDGTANPNIAFARQVVRVRPGATYTLKGFVKTESLTTSNGVYLRVAGIGTCQGLSKGSEMLTGTNRWREVSFDFTAPAGCEAAVIEARRDFSQKFDNKIEGTAWIDGITLKPLSPLLTQSSRKP